MNQGNHGRTQFQVDRIAFFSDAIIAIAITLLVLEIKIPSVGQNTSWHDVRTVYTNKLLFPLLSLFFSFFIIGRLWMRHHELFEHVINYNRLLIRYNLYFLFSIVLLPVSTMFMMDKENPETIRIIVYLSNLALCHLFFLVLLMVITKKENQFFDPHGNDIIRKEKEDCILFIVFLLITILLFIIKPNWAPFSVIILLARRIFLRVKKLSK
ncbi:MAG: TMEM175 family protein [Ginsengibacter sp.]